MPTNTLKNESLIFGIQESHSFSFDNFSFFLGIYWKVKIPFFGYPAY